MSEQMDLTGGDLPEKPKRGRLSAMSGSRSGGTDASRSQPAPSLDEAAGESTGKDAEGVEPSPAIGRSPSTAAGADAETGSAEFADVGNLTKKGLRVVTVVTGAVVDDAGSFVFYLDGRDDARTGVQAQVNHLLGSGPAREEHLAPARTRARQLLDKLSRPRS